MATASRAGTRLDLYRDLARQLRVDSIRCSTAAGSGHPTSSLSAADLMAVLLAGHLRYDYANADDPANDHLIFSKGHASPLVYAMFRAAGAITDEELLTFRKLGSRLEGHPTPLLPWVDVATGSLGQGLPIGVGIALAGKRPLAAPYHVWALVGDSETAEGSIWEAFDHGGHEGLSNLTAILDINRLGQRGPTELQWDRAAYAARIRAFGWDAIVIDGHDLAAVDDALGRARGSERPTAIVAKTVKGKGVSFLEDKEGWHGKALDKDQAAQALKELGAEPARTFHVAKPPHWTPPAVKRTAPHLPTYIEPVPTRKADGEAIAALGAARADHGSTVLYPCDGTQTAKLVAAMADREGISYIRTTRANTPALYTADDAFPIGGSKVVRGGGSDDRVAVIAAGITLHEAAKAADDLAKGGLRVRVIDAYSVKPIDGETLAAAAKATGGRIVVVEDHWPEGGIGDAVLAALADRGVRDLRYRHLAVRKMPGSGKPAELLADVGIDATAIAKAVRELAA